MRKLLQRPKAPGLEPGTLVHVGERKPQEPRATVLRYGDGRVEERAIDLCEGCPVIEAGAGITWISVTGIADQDVLERLGECFGLHRLVLEDIMNADQRVKVDDFGDYLYVVVKAIEWREAEQEIGSEQISIVLGPHFVISLQEADPDCFAPLRERLIAGKARALEMGADFLAYALLDLIVDRYFVALEKLGDEVELMEDDLIEDPSPELLQSIHRVKREMIFLRKSTWPLREVVGALERRETPLITHAVAPYLRDLYDHTVQVIDSIEALRDLTAGMLDIYLSSVSNRLNVVMKLLAVIGAVFMPLTFIVGVYGMNFQLMPELGWRWGYPVVLTAMAGIAGWMLCAFRRRGWL
ncbi:MAG: magnesium/cobalt transporter CorA [Armatimonadetes bacterium]|nr:magnesium/cobalt transporter CorA [Armatimonadota bacterium]